MQLSLSMAGKFAGELQWTSQNIFLRLGRAMLVPLYRRQHCRHGFHSLDEGSPLHLCLKWWQQVLTCELRQSHSFFSSRAPVVHLYVDAHGHPARIAAVLVLDGQMFHADFEPPEDLF